MTALIRLSSLESEWVPGPIDMEASSITSSVLLLYLDSVLTLESTKCSRVSLSFPSCSPKELQSCSMGVVSISDSTNINLIENNIIIIITGSTLVIWSGEPNSLGARLIKKKKKKKKSSTTNPKLGYGNHPSASESCQTQSH